MLIQKIIGTRYAALNFCIALLLTYAALPAAIYWFLRDDPYFIKLSQLTVLSVVMITVGYLTPIFDWRFNSQAKRLRIDALSFHILVWTFFLIFVIVTTTTAESLPLISAFRGASATVLSQQRGEFLKARAGAGASLVYLSSLFVSSLLPYSLANLFINRQRFRYFLLIFFLFYSISFLQKALFINVLFPLLYVFVIRDKGNSVQMLFIGFVSAAILYILTILAFGYDSYFYNISNAAVSGDFWAASYLPSNPIDYLIWRIVAVPMFTAADTLRIFAEQFNGNWLWGATSSFFSTLFFLDRIPLEKLVYEYQWGWNDTANANANFIAEAYVNFGWIGVIFFSLFVGQTLRWFRRSHDFAFKSLWLIYCFGIFSSGLIGTMLSNGYTLIFCLSMLVNLTSAHPRKIGSR